jgi:hypothetical protein
MHKILSKKCPNCQPSTGEIRKREIEKRRKGYEMRKMDWGQIREIAMRSRAD